MTSAIPPLCRRVAGTTPLHPGDTLPHVCARFGQPPAAYRDLVAANLHRELRTDLPDGVVATLTGLSQGDSLYVPASWVGSLDAQRAYHQRGVLHGAPAELSDAVDDKVIALLGPNDPTGPLTMDAYKDLMGTLAAWWRQAKPNTLPNSKQELSPFAPPLKAFWQLIGKDLTPGTAPQIPWGEMPFLWIVELSQRGFDWSKVDKNIVNKRLITLIPPGGVKHGPRIKDWSKAKFDPETIAKTKMFAPQWQVLGRFRWDLLPETMINPNNYNGQDPTTWLVQQINQTLGSLNNAQPGQADVSLGPLDLISCGMGQVKLGGSCYGLAPIGLDGSCPAGSLKYSTVCVVSPCQPGQIATVSAQGVSCSGNGQPQPGNGQPGNGQPQPGGPQCPKGANPVGVSCDCSPLGPLFVYDPINSLCVNCGPNAVYNAQTGECGCVAGASAPPGGALGSGCVMDNNTTPPVVVEKTNTVEKNEMSTGTKVVIGVGVVLGLIAAISKLKKKG